MKDKKNMMGKGLILFTVVIVLVIVGIGITKLRNPEDDIEQSREETIEVEPEEEKEDYAIEVQPQSIDSKPFLTEKTSNKESGKTDTKKEENQKKSDDSDIEGDMTPLPKDAKVVTVENDGMTKEERKKNTKVQKNYSEENAPEKVIKDNTPEYKAEEKQDEIVWERLGDPSEKSNTSSNETSGKSSGGYLE